MHFKRAGDSHGSGGSIGRACTLTYSTRREAIVMSSPPLPLLEAAALPSVFTLGKESFALGKVRSAKFFSAKGLCRVLFIGALGKIKKKLPSVWGGTRQNISAIVTPAVNGCFAECPTQHSANFF